MAQKTARLPRTTFLPFSPPDITEDEIAEVIETLRSGWITTGPRVRKFQDQFAEALGVETAVAMSSCTAALHTSLVIHGVQEGDEVITTPLTFCSTVNVIEHVGARPVLVDVEPDTLNIDPKKVEDAITPRTKAIIVVHYSGHPVDLNAFARISEKFGVPIIEDAAHAFGSKFEGVPIGQSRNLTAFSFYATKNLTTGEGGMLTGPKDLVDRARQLVLHGMNKDAWKRYDHAGSWYYEVDEPGFKYNMTDIQAALGLVQLRRFESMQARRREIVEIYQKAFLELSNVVCPTVLDNIEHSWHLYVLRFNLESLNKTRDVIIEDLKNLNIGTSVHFIPIHLHPYYSKKYSWKKEDFPIAYHNYCRMISLPLNSKMSDSDAEDVIDALRVVLQA
jgi:dTDP-4-amino-4,6-dideoxygalactose transaminase